jgi:hypothetical protein
MQKYFLLPVIFIIFLIVVACNSSPVKICPDNPHYFFYRNKSLVLITSDQHYGAVIDKDFDYDRYLITLMIMNEPDQNLSRAMFEPTDKYLPVILGARRDVITAMDKSDQPEESDAG